ncbi:MAG: UDP-glucose 6-dehydrogenase AglM [Promethearchaeota archaeon]|nr:MAG: UDP-glucose 6-dehydrogenase AglM [Candidatus Lokiarchaeota archaeon]
MGKGNISIAGCGFVGLVHAAALASRGFNVIATTIKEDEAKLINSGKPPFYEKDLDELLKEAVGKENLKVITDNREAILNSDITFITVGTPMREDHSIDLSYIEAVSKEIGKALQDKDGYHLIVDRSTVVPGTTRNLIGENIEKESGKLMGKDFGLCMQPEFLREGASVYDTFHPNRIIIGEVDKKSGDVLEQMLREFYGEPFPPYERMNIESAEMVKYANNCFLATKISFANEFANYSELVPNVDITEVMKGLGMDDRVNPKFFGAGIGFGGSCFPKDVNAIKAWGEKLGFQSKILDAVLEVNKERGKRIVQRAEELLGSLEGKKVSLLGLSFKPDTSDMREAPSIKIVNELRKRNVKEIVGYDPKANGAAKEVFGEDIVYAESIEDALQESECAFLVTEWEEFRNLSPDHFKDYMKEPNLIDGRRLYPYDTYSKKIAFKTIGRK